MALKEYKNIVTTHLGTFGVISHNIRRKSSHHLNLNFNKVILLEDPELRSIQLITNKKFRERNFQETSDLNNFLLKTKIENEFKADMVSSNTTIETILYYTTQFMEVKTFKKRDFIYISGDKSDNIYLVLKGEVSLNKIETEKVDMTMEEYYNYLKTEIKNQVDPMLIKNIIDTNSYIFPLRRQNDLNDMDNIVMLIKLTQATNELSAPTIEKIKLIYLQYKKEHRLYHFDLVVKGDKDMKRFHADLMEKITERERYYNYLMQNTNNEAVPIMKMYYHCIRSAKPFSYFGNFKLWNIDTIIRSETAICESDVSAICINKRLYGLFIQNEQKQLKEKEMEKVHQLYFFRDISKNRFHKDIYHGFDVKEYFRGQILFDSYGPLDCFYIVKEGLIDLTLKNTSLLELDNTLEALKQCDRKLFSLDEAYIMNHPYSLIQAHLEKKRTYKVFGSSKKQMFGDWELYYNKKRTPFTATITSEKAIVYSYKYINFENETEDKVLLTEGLKQQAYGKLSLILERLKTIRFSFYKKIDTEVQRKLKEEELVLPQNYSEAISLKNTHIKMDPNKMNRRIQIIPERETDLVNITFHKKNKTEELGLTIKTSHDQQQQQQEDKAFDNLDMKLITSLHNYNKPKGNQLKYFLPPIHLDLSESKKREIEHLKKANKNVITTELSNTYFNKKSAMRVMWPQSTVQNVPLMNKLKYSNSNQASKKGIIDNNIDSLSKSISKINCSNEQKVKHSFKNIPGAYYMAVQQLITK